jgi:PAS domain S-box-containing protein
MDPSQASFWTRAIADSNELVFVVDMDRRVVAVSGGAARALGCDAAELVGRPCWTIMHGEHGLPPECPLAGLLADGCAHDGDVHSSTLDRDFFVTVTPVPDERGDVVAAVHTAYDMTERRRIEDRLRESEATVRTLVENASEVMARFDVDTRCLYMSPAVEAWLGRRPDEFVGRRLADLGVSTGFAELFADAHRRVLDTHRPVDVSFSFDGPSGRRHAEARLTPELDGGGRPLSLVCVMRDVTEQKAAAKALERSMRLLEHGERLARLGSWEWDVASDTSLVSAEWQRIHGLTGERLSNDEIALTCHPDDRAAVQAAWARAVTGAPYRVDHRIVLPSGETRHLMTYGIPVFDADGAVESVLGASLDVTERVLANEALVEREHRLQRALSDTVAALGATVAQRDPYTAGHEVRVAELACRIGERLGWDETVLTPLRTAALVHDVGKIAIPAEILSKPTRLAPVEFELIKAHPRAGYDILAGIAFEDHVADIVLQHHERLDGSGYPDGLLGPDILPAARVLAVADVVEAMVSHRPYRPALLVDEAIREIRSGLGTRYDAAAADACLRLLIDEAFTFSEN